MGKLPLKVIVPITDWKDNYQIAPWMVKIVPNNINGLSKISAVDCFQIRSLSKDRLIKKIGAIDNATLEEIKTGISKIIGW